MNSRRCGKRLLVTGGAGFLGHYFVQAILHANRRPGRAPIALTIYDSFVRGIPGWLTGLADDPNLTVVRHDMTRPLPADMPDHEFIIHAASIASPTYYRRDPIGTMDATVNGLRALLDRARAQQDRSRPSGFSSCRAAGSTAIRRRAYPTPETYRGYVSCRPRPAAAGQRYGETLSVTSPQYGIPVGSRDRSATTGPAQISDRRVLPDPRDIWQARHRDALGRIAKRAFCYVAGGDRLQRSWWGTQRRGVQRRRRGAGGVDGRVGEHWPVARACSLRRQGDARHQPGRGLPRGQPNQLSIISKTYRAGLRPGGGARRRLRRTLLWYRDNAAEDQAKVAVSEPAAWGS
jgi:hypothetical protein